MHPKAIKQFEEAAVRMEKCVPYIIAQLREGPLRRSHTYRCQRTWLLVVNSNTTGRVGPPRALERGPRHTKEEEQAPKRQTKMGNESSADGGGGGLGGLSVSISASAADGKAAQEAHVLAYDDDVPASHEHSYKDNLTNQVAVQDICSAILGGLTADDIRYHWLHDHDPGPRTREQLEALLLKLTQRYSKLYKSSFQTAFRNYANCESTLSSWQQERDAIEGKLKRIYALVAEKHQRLSEAKLGVMAAEQAQLLDLHKKSADESTMELDAFSAVYTSTLGPKMLLHFIGDDIQAFLHQVAREAQETLAVT